MSTALSPIAEQLAGLSREEKLALLARLARDKQSEGDADFMGGESSYPLSFSQQRLFFLHHLEEGENVHTQFRGMWLEGALDVAALDRSLAEIQRRHEALRTRFEGGGEHREPRQLVDPPKATLLEVVEVPGATSEERRDEARRLAALEAARPFDLERGPVLRAKLLKLSETEQALLLGLHHIVSDGWSRGILFAELAALYGAFSAGLPSPLPEPRAQLGAFARAQRQRLSGDRLAREIDFWRQRLADAPSRIELPWDRPRRGMVTPQGELVHITLAAETADGLRALARAEGATSFMVLLALYDAILARFTGQRDLVVGLPAAGRDSTALEGAIGCFANTFVQRLRLDPEASFRDLLGRVRAEIAAVLPHTEMPFEKLVEDLAPQRDFSYNPIFQVMFAVQEVGGGGFVLPGLTTTPLAVERAMANVDLTLELLDKSGSGPIRGFFDFATDLFDRASIESLARQLEVLAAAIVADPDQPLARLPLFSAAEHRAVLALGEAPARPIAAPVVERFAAWAQEAGDRVALIDGQAFWSYEDLDRRANQLARVLVLRGVKADERVGICLPRGFDQLLSVLAVAKAGGAYVPLDPAYPKQRLQMMVDDSRLLLILTDAVSASTLPPPIDPDEQFLLEEEGAELDRQSTEPLPPRALLDHLAYLIFTSGSTGKPKAVAVPHRGVTNHASAFVERFGLYPGCRALYSATLSFDVSCEEIYPVWCAGATLVALPPGAFPTFNELIRLIADQRLTHVDLPTPYWHEWVSHLAAGGELPPACLELVVVGTEQASAERLGEWFKAVGDRPRWVNAYGPTETTISASAYTPTADAWCGPLARVPIGKPIENVRAYVLDHHLQPQPAGVPGDLYLGGPGVVRGYWRRPGLTAERFVPDPFSPTHSLPMGGGRLYTSGDRARLNARGEIEFLGRLDDQVKIRGFRIELGEIAEVIRRHTRVQDCAVLVRQEEGGPMLAAYVVATPSAQGTPLTPQELGRHLADALPAYMVPTVTLLAELPLTAAGKVDRKALEAMPTPGREEVHEEEAEAAPLDPITATVAAVWCSVLGLERIGPDEDFFEIGGHSLLATRVIARLKQALNVDIGLAAFFDARTVAALAKRVTAERLAGRKTAPPLVPVSREGGVICSFSQQRLWFLDRLLPDSPANHIPQLIRFRGAVSAAALEGALLALVRRHESLRTTFALAATGPKAGQVLQHIAEPPEGRRAIQLPSVDLSALGTAAEAVAARLATRESLRRFDLAKGPMLRATLLRLAAPSPAAMDCILDLSTHHIVSDGVSIGLLISELVALYGEAAGGAAANLPALPVAYADFAAWQRGWLRGEALDEQMAYWRSALAGAPAALDLPLDRPRPAVETFNGRRVPLHFPTALVHQLEATGRSHGATLFMVLTALLKSLLARASGQDDVVMGWPISGRNLTELERVQGFFSNILVLRTDLSGTPHLGQLIERVRTATLGAYDHQEMPFEKLVEELAPERNLAHNPIFQVFFVLHHQSGGRGLRLPAVEVSVPSLDNGTSRLDLLLSLMETQHGLAGFFEYNTDLFDHATITRLGSYLPRLAEAALAAPQRPVATLELLEAPARQQLIFEWNDSAVDRASRDVPAWVAAVARERPGNVAVRFGGETLTYGELDRQSLALAQHLLRLGMRPEEPVGVALERSLELPVVLLGVLRAGGAYLPLDPNFPPARLEYVVDDSGARLLLTEPGLRHHFDEGTLEVVEILPGLEGIEVASEPVDLPALDLDQLAYLIYTSGSTGQPKGVAVPHRGVASFLATLGENPGLSSRDVLFAVTTISFDIHVLELWLPLVSGAQVEVVDATTAADGKLLARALEDGGATVMQATPATWRQLLAAGWKGKSDLTALCGGEALTEDLARELLPKVKRLVNVYGPTETTVWSARERVGAQTHHRSVAIGRPIAATELHLFDARGGVALPGTVGELAIGGAGVVRGYHRRAALTAERFTPNPHATPPGSRVYRTGDLCCQLADGRLEFRRRRDHQVKVRGFRIELGEVETVLGRHPAVAQCVATVDSSGGDNERLVAFYVPAAGQAGAGVSAGNLRASLRELLPDYMIPSLLVPLTELPLTPNGKVDRKALPPSPHAVATPVREHVPPEGTVEESLAEIWREVLKVERVGRHDRFFDLGGHSLMATQVLTRVLERFGVEVPLRSLFEANTVASLAEVIIAKELDGVDSGLLERLLADLDEEAAPSLAETPSQESDRRPRGDVDA